MLYCSYQLYWGNINYRYGGSITMSSNVLQGKVKWFDPKKGFGFILLGDGESTQDIFVHFSAIQVEGFKTLHEGDEVEFELAKNERGQQATQVTVTKKAPRRKSKRDADGDREEG